MLFTVGLRLKLQFKALLINLSRALTDDVLAGLVCFSRVRLNGRVVQTAASVVEWLEVAQLEVERFR